MSRHVVVIAPDDSGGYVVTAPGLPGCVTHGDTLEDAQTNARAAIELYLDGEDAASLAAAGVRTDLIVARFEAGALAWPALRFVCHRRHGRQPGARDGGGGFGSGGRALMGGWREEWETKGYRDPLSVDRTDFLRVRMRIERGRQVRFTAQYEAVIDGRIYPVIRYDTAHGDPHRDTLDRHCTVVDKKWFWGAPLGQTLRTAIADIRADWPAYRAVFEDPTP